MFNQGLYLRDDVLALARAVAIEETPRAAPLDRPGWAEIALDGEAPSRAAASVPFGNAGNAMPLAALVRKFEENAAAMLGADAPAVAADMMNAPAERPFAECLAQWLGRRSSTRDRAQTTGG
jgi:hypothetical protein